MKKLKLFLVAVTALALTAFTLLETVNWNIKDNYAITFKGGKVSGGFKGLKAIISFDGSNPSHSRIWASIDVSSINTGNNMRDGHALSESALDAKQYPLITFESSSVAPKGTAYEAAGKLTIKGITKDVTLPFMFEDKGGEGVFKGTFSIATKDFNITRSGVPEQLDVMLEIPVKK